MANVLRELIARVVLRVDDSTIKRLDTQLDAVKSHIAQTQAQAQQGLNVNVDVNATDAERALFGIRTALTEMGGAVSEASLSQLSEQFTTASATADRLRADIEQIQSADPGNPKLGELQRQLRSIESESLKTSAALDRAKHSLDGVGSSGGHASGMLGQLKVALGGLGLTIGAAGLVNFVGQTLEAAGAVEDLSDRLGMGIEEVQVWSAFSKHAGADNEALSASVKGLANAMQGAASGGKEQRAAFEELGIKTDAWKKGLPSLTETLALVGGKLGEVDNEGKRLALTQKLLSEGGLKLAPAFKGGTEAVQEQLDKLKELSVVYSEDFVRSAGAAGDELDMFYGQFRGLGSELILTFLPALRGAVRELTPVIRGLREGFTNGHLFGASLTSAGVLGLASFGGIGGAIARFAPLLGRLAAMAAPFIWAFAKFAVLALILDDFFVMLNGGKSVLGELLGKFEVGRAIIETFQMGFRLLKGTVLSVWGALSGDPEAVAQGAALLDQYAAWISKFGENVKFMFTDLFTRAIPQAFTDGFSAVDEFLGGALSSILGFVSTWASEIGAVLGGIWDAALSGLVKMISAAGKLLSKVPGLGFLEPEAGDTPEPGAPKRPPSNGSNALDVGSPNAPTVTTTNNRGPVTINNNQSVTTTITGNSSKEVVAAVARTERATVAAVRDNRQTLRHVVGATR